MALIRSLTTRAKRICSQAFLSAELEVLRGIFISNGYPISIIERFMECTLRDSTAAIGPKKCPIYLKLPWLGDVSTKFEDRIAHVISTNFPALRMVCCFSSRSTFATTNKDLLSMHQLSNVIYSFTCRCGREYIGKTTQRLSERIRQHIPVSLTNAAVTFRSLQPGENITSLPKVEQLALAKYLAASRSDSAVSRHLKDNHDCLRAFSSSNLFDCFTVVSRARNQFHLDVLEAVFIKLRTPVLCQQKEFVKALYLV